MRRTALLLTSLLLCCAVVAKRIPPKRPRILGIAGATILVSNVADARNFYLKLIDPNHVCNYCEQAPARFLFLPNGQRITLEKAPDPLPANLLGEVSLLTEDLEGFKRYFHANKIEFGEVRQKRGGELIRIVLQDPEGHHISITDSYHLANADDLSAGLPPSHARNSVRIIHAGFIVNDRAAADHFYQDVLGFHLYWHGGMKDDETSWVAMQVPDGTDWVEYMLNISPTADKRTRGVMNHISLGVPDIHAIQAQIVKAGVKLTEQPQIGRNGKWQLNLYDADATRVEFMEFTPVQKPCCSEFAGAHPGPHP